MNRAIQLAVGLIILSINAAFAHSDAFKPAFVDTLIAPYLEIQTGLAADDLAAAKKGASHFQHAMKAAPHAKDAHDASIALSTSAKKILEATDIKSARVEFLNLSGQFTTLVEHVGTSNKTQLYIAHCPMAFGNKGGSWVQSDKTLANPYYGAMMLRCGSLQKQIAGKASNTESHEGHSH